MPSRRDVKRRFDDITEFVDVLQEPFPIMFVSGQHFVPAELSRNREQATRLRVVAKLELRIASELHVGVKAGIQFVLLFRFPELLNVEVLSSFR